MIENDLKMVDNGLMILFENFKSNVRKINDG